MKGAPNLTPDEIDALTLEEAWAVGHTRQVEWARANLTQAEIDRVAIAAVDLFVESCESAAKAAAA